MAKRMPEVGYDPAELDPAAPTFYISRTGDHWELRRDGVLLSTHPRRVDAVRIAREHSRVRYSNILAEGSTGRLVVEMEQDPELLELYREMDRIRGV